MAGPRHFLTASVSEPDLGCPACLWHGHEEGHRACRHAEHHNAPNPVETGPLPGTALDANHTEAQVAAYVDAVKLAPNRRDLLVKLLPEQHPIYSGRSTNATVRMRGYILAAFAQVGLPPAGLPYVLDELQNGRDAYLVAAAARALRGVDLPTEHLAPYLMAAIANVRYHDDALSFDAYRPVWPLERYTTAVDEILATLGWLGVHAREHAAGPRSAGSRARSTLRVVASSPGRRDRQTSRPRRCR